MACAQNGSGKISVITIEGDNGAVSVIKKGLKTPPAVEPAGDSIWIAAALAKPSRFRCRSSMEGRSLMRRMMFHSGPAHIAAGLFLAIATATAAPKAPIPPATADAKLTAQPSKETAVFAGGCFWGVQAVFQRVKGVVATTTGYSGGAAKTATYKQVVTETTGHAESVEVIYDPSRITYGQLLRIYFSVAHDPTELNRQGPDVGTSYRSAIFYTNEEQQKLAKAYIAQLDSAKVFPKPIVTEVTPLKAFYRAEDYHQDYAYYNPNNPYIEVCDRPKIEALKQQFPELFIDYKPKK